MRDNPADILATYVTAEALNEHLYNVWLSSPHIMLTAYKHVYRSTSNSSMRVQYIHPCWRHGFAIPCIDNDNVTFIILDFWQNVKLLDWWQTWIYSWRFLLHGVFNNGWINNSEWNKFIAWGSQFCLSTYSRSNWQLGEGETIFFLFAWSCFRETTRAYNMHDVNNTSSLKNRRTMIETASPDYKSWSICRMAAKSHCGRTSQQSNMSIQEFLSRSSSPRTTIWLGAQLSTLQRIGTLTKAEWDNVIDESKKYWFPMTTMDEYNLLLDFNNGRSDHLLEQTKTNEWGGHSEVNNEFSWKWQPPWTFCTVYLRQFLRTKHVFSLQLPLTISSISTMLISRVLNNTVPTIWGTVLKYIQHCLLYLWCTYKCTYNLDMFGSRLQEPLGQCRTIALEKTIQLSEFTFAQLKLGI